MAVTSWLSLSVAFLVFFHGCFAQLPFQGEQQQHPWQGGQRHRLRSKSECNIQNINALEPTRKIQSEGGMTEFWDENDEQFDCAGVTLVRHVIQPKGLLLPSFTNAPRLSYIVQGTGVTGAVFPGCAETFQSSSSSQSRRREGREQRPSGDQHQKIRNIRRGDILALPAGVTLWAYNDGEEPLVSVSLFDTSNDANQLDQNNVRRFFLAGSSQQEEQTGHGRSERGRQGGQGGRSQGNYGDNIFKGFDEQMLANAFDVEPELIQKMQRPNKNRGNIIQVREGLRLVTPQDEDREERRQGRGNGLEETLCTMRLVHNINDPSRADVFNPHGGRITSLNSQTLPILDHLRLNAERGVLYQNGILAPQWNVNAHSVVYITSGNGRLQIVGDNGENVFDGQVQEGQVVVVPQNFAVVKKADRQGLAWVAFKTNDNAMTHPLAGKLSAIRSMPLEVLQNSYDISREDAQKLKYNREEVTVFGPRSRSQEAV
ncbi:hypothetical protein L1049_016031 [Liquidambar formosana]|uniref:Cupin type-1 domain-containing protein n=1 Tax=Liquidambar formosana TaxID=63359 RepID=A0AAP0S4K0_LIQFO